jgi:hypothetical protein
MTPSLPLVEAITVPNPHGEYWRAEHAEHRKVLGSPKGSPLNRRSKFVSFAPPGR